MKNPLRVLRAFVVTVSALLVSTPVALYILLATPWAQERLCGAARAELTALLGVPVSVGEVRVHPFSRVDVHDVSVSAAGSECLRVERLGARFELYHFLRTGRIVFDYAFVDRPVLRLTRDSEGAPLNIAPVIERLKGDGSDSGARFRFKVATLSVRDGRISYDVLDAPEADSSRFSAQHIEFSAVQLHACLRLISNDAFDVELDRLSFAERSGLELRGMSARVQADTAGISLDDLRVSLQNTAIALDAFYDRRTHAWCAETDSAFASVVYPPDFAPLLPALADAVTGFGLKISACGDTSSARLTQFQLSSLDKSIVFSAHGEAAHMNSPDEYIDLHSLRLTGDVPRLCAGVRRVLPSKGGLLDRLALLGHADVRARARLTGRSEGRLDLQAATAAGNLEIDASVFTADTFATSAVKMSAQLDGFALGGFIRQRKFGAVSASLEADGRVARGAFIGSASLADASVEFNGRRCSGISASARFERGHASGVLDVDDRAMQVAVNADVSYGRAGRALRLEGDLDCLDLNWLGLASDSYAGFLLNAAVEADVRGRNVDDLQGRVALSGVNFRDADGRGVEMRALEIVRDLEARTPVVELNSDFVNGRIEGQFTPSRLSEAFAAIAHRVFPALAGENAAREHNCSDAFDFELTVADAEPLSEFFKLPVSIIHPIEIDGALDCRTGTFRMALDAPYLQQGDKIIDNTALFAAADAAAGRATVYATTHMPTKKGPMAAVLSVDAFDNIATTDIDWTIERKIPLNGALSFDTGLGLGADGRIAADVEFRPGTINFGDDVWRILPAHLSWSDGAAVVDDFVLEAGEQRVSVDGCATASEDAVLTVDIERVSLLPIFETLEINNALISGTATGTFEGRALLGPAPVLTSESLHVDSIGYNRCLLGRSADVRASWDNDSKAVVLDASIVGLDGLPSSIAGTITPGSEELDLDFDVQHVPVGFMQPFMKAFASSVDGYASGHARLFGTFKYIDLEGDVFADSLALKIDFTGTEYFCTDSLHIRPGVIDVRGAVIRDINGHTAGLDGTVRHNFFMEPSFDFRVKDARDFLCYDVSSKQSPDWYGTIYGNGGAHIYGEPGVVNIDVNMATAAGSTFTFVLNDMLDADEYSFMTFRDRTPQEVITDSIVAVERVPEAVLEYQQRMASQAEETTSDYNMDFRVDITPAARINLVMDPVGGDEIRAYGAGAMRLTYGSANNDLRMFGNYTLERGSYNFTLQDIIIKDFTINEGSNISFHGDPYAAQLDIEAVYAVNANLSDLDESFLQDRELNRTNVPVHALMKVRGDMRQPDISFDLRFPTLSSDVYRKVRSIVSTEEMMNRQIIYLLALNRFYTPDYMSTTKGNELFSVASSTISSQLGNMLGKLSENWTIAPNLRSDRGDFSDVEVDVALSSRLLNNRLLFNGNFGYRDKSLNNNQFIGDFDIEYLLNRRGTWRLKAYNRYNDQNYYLRSAATTQGIGIMFKRDFDSLLDWLRPFKRKREAAKAAQSAAEQAE